jgi:nucleoside-diphosphate-sugar epimerase
VEQIITIFNKGKNGEIYHVGMDKEQTITQLVKDVANILGIQIGIVPGQIRKGGTSRRCPNIDRVCSLGYSKNNHYREGLKKTVEWYRDYFLKEEDFIKNIYSGE